MEYIEENAKLQKELEAQFGVNETSNEIDLTGNPNNDATHSPTNSTMETPSTPLRQCEQKVLPSKVPATPYPLSAFKTPCGDSTVSPADTYFLPGKAIYCNEYNDGHGPGVDPTESIISEAFQRKDPP